MKPATVAAFVIVLSVLLQAQAPALQPAASQTQDPLPVRRVVLYKSGVGYFEHLGRVRGNQTVTIDFTSGQLDDVLKSLTALDLDGGRVSGVSYNSEAGLDRRLGALRLPVGEQTTRAGFLNALRGAKLDIRNGATRVIGRLLSVERIERRNGTNATQVDAVSVVTDAGEIQTVALDPGVSVKIVEAGLNQEVAKYLSLVASVRDQDVRRLTIATAGTGARDLFVSYVSEVPVWKATYRLVLPAASQNRKPLLQGWAIVDNTVGEDWDGVQLSLVAGAPQAFVQAISRPYYVQRPVVPLPQRVLMSPQTHQGALAVSGQSALTGTVTDRNGGALPGVTVRASRGGTVVSQAVTDASGRFRLGNVSPGTYDVSFQLSGFGTVNFAAVNVSSGMESILNTAMDIGTANETVSVTAGSPAVGSGFGGGGGGRGGRGGAAGGVVGGLPSATMKTLDSAPPAFRSASEGLYAAMNQQQVDATAAQLGDLFEYKLKEPVTIRKNQSALVPILNSEVQAEKVSLWNAASGAPRALRAVWLTNATGSTLDSGSFSIIEGEAFAGEGLMDPLKAGERRLLSYAMDLAITIDAKSEQVPTRLTSLRISRGVVVEQMEEHLRSTYAARNEDAEARTLVIEHPVRAGWTLGGTVKPVESTPAWHRFRVTIEPKTAVNFVVEETRPSGTQFSVSSVTDDQVTLLVREKILTAPQEAALREVIARKGAIAALNQQIAARQNEISQIGTDQDRVRENMRSLKGSSEEKQLLQRYVKQLNDQESRLEALRKELEDLTARRQKAQEDLNRFIEGIG
ncbi:MAG TPA: carboxypeptidase regulatory-like domain-containing protein [Vicinamibacterales bacterium]|nr:carboxypeptidase regulatory-like domain-containing protein [Vicinamibacterales bacterium]